MEGRTSSAWVGLRTTETKRSHLPSVQLAQGNNRPAGKREKVTSSPLMMSPLMQCTTQTHILCIYVQYACTYNEHKLRQTDIRIHDIHTCMQPTDTHHYHLHYIVVLPCCQGNWIKAGTTYDVRLQPPPHFTWCCPPLVFRSEHHNYLAQTFILTSRMYMHMYLRTYTYVCMYAHTHVCILCILCTYVCMYVCMYIDR